MDLTQLFLERNKLSPETYEGYLDQAEAFLKYSLRLVPFCLPFQRPRLLKSKLFGQRYLVANFHPSSQHQKAFNATAYMSLDIGSRKSPPMVLTGKRTGSAKTYNWILEHEYVHLHQMLQGRMPKLEDKVGNPAVFLSHRAELEFEAHYLQLVHQGNFDPDECLGMGVEHWSCFRSYTCSLEDTLACILSDQYSLEVTEDFLAHGPESLRKELGRIAFGAFEPFINNFASNFPGYISVALTNVCERMPGQLLGERIELVRRWLIDNLPEDSPDRAVMSTKVFQPERRAYFVDYEVTYRGRVGPFYVQSRDGHFDLTDNEELVDASIDSEATESRCVGFIQSFCCAECGEPLEFEGTEDDDSEELLAIFHCGCTSSE